VVVLGLLLPVMLACGGSGAHFQQTQTPTPPEVPLTRLSTDTFTNPSSQHATEVEPDTFAFGSTIVSAFQVGRIFGGGASDIGFATSTNGGAAWTSGFLPGITIFQGGGTFSAASDPAVAFDAKPGVWIISSLGLGAFNEVVVSRSLDGINWGNPVTVKVSATSDVDKDWIVCDNTATSPFYGQCYLQWDDPSANGLIWMSTSTDGGQTWGPALNTADLAHGIGGQPVVQPNGTVVVPYEGLTGFMQSFTSTNGGVSWNASVTISSITDHLVAGGLRTSPLPSAAIDAAGTVYVVWQDCRFRSACASNDLVMSASSDSSVWTAPARIPIDPVSSTVDHFIPGLAVDPATGGDTARLALTYYWYSQANCILSTCALNVGFVSSQDGGSTWSKPQLLAGPMSVAWLPNTFSGRMVGDYISTSYCGGKAYGVFAVARKNSGTIFDEAIFTNTAGFAAIEGEALFSSTGEQTVPNAQSDHAPRQFYDLEHRYPVKPPNN